MTLIVVGGGICGSSLVRAARATGREAVLVSASPPNSLAATAVMREVWHRRHNEVGLFGRSLELYQEWGVTVRTGPAVVTSYRSGRHWVTDWYMIAPEVPLVQPDFPVMVERHPKGVKLADGMVLTGRVLWATGNGNDRSYGVTWVNDNPAAALTEPENLRIHNITQYKLIAAGEVGGRARLGSSTGRTPQQAVERGLKLFEQALELGMVQEDSGWQQRLGMRCKSSTDDLGGLYRTGYALAPALGEQIVRKLGRGK